MRFKTNVVVGLVFVGLLAYVYVFEIREREQQREAAEKSSLLLDVEEDQVAALTIDKGDSVIVLENRQDGWWLQQPVADLADDAAVDRLVRNIRESKRERVLVDSAVAAAAPEKAEQYQLQPPRLELTVEMKEQGGSHVIRYGADNPTDTYVYVQEGGDNPEIFTIRAWRFDNVDKKVFDLRDRRVLAFAQDEVVEIDLEYPGNTVSIARGEAGEWRLSAPVAARADADAVDDLLRGLDNSKIAAFVDEDPGEETLDRHGLATPMVTAVLTIGDDRAEKRLTVAGERGVRESGRLARDASRTPVFRIDSTLVEKLQVSVFDLRDKEPMGFNKDGITRVELIGTGGSFVAEKDTADVWSIVDPEAVAAKTWVLRGFLSDVERLEVAEFVRDGVGDAGLAEFGLDEPAIRVDLFAGDERALSMAVGSAPGERAYVMRADESSVYAIDRDKLDGIDLAVDEVWEKPRETPPASVAKDPSNADAE